MAIGPDNETVIMVDYLGGSVVYGRVNAARNGLESVNELVLCPNWDPDSETCGPEEYHAWPINVTISPDGATAIVPDAFWGMVSVLSITGPGQVQPGTPFQLWGLGDTYADFVAREYGDGRPARAAGQSVAFSPDGARAYLVQNGTYEWEDTNPDPDVLPGAEYRPSSRERVQAFQCELTDRGIPTTVRLRRGIDIQAGCGQLRQRHGRKSA